ncbi:uncharacterized protein LOC112088921 [Eutrema salsugineum]|uniref:uncharacterized protein LOC112088921 n=1 Tax=Eutrema salsugineum TaxID=72664 RepID=UPI000CED15FA|nr:uncharacterized protein LOC112088921 [Eutrema salsugineum]
MRVFCWNVKGLNSHSRQSVVRNWITINRHLVGGFLETRVREVNASAILSSLLPGWRIETNYEFADNGRIWLVWDPSISVMVFKKTNKFIHDLVTNFSFLATFVYASNFEVQRLKLWDDISIIRNSSPVRFRPWLLVGDFNQIASVSEHFSVIHASLPLRGISQIQDCMEVNELSDMPSRGLFFTWTNCRPEDPILRKLDRALMNENWLNSFPDSMALFDPLGDSDYAPCLVSLDSAVGGSKKSLKYFSFLATHPRFSTAISEPWNAPMLVGSAMFKLSSKMNAAKIRYRQLNKEGFGNIHQRTKEALEHLESIQKDLLTNPLDNLFIEEHVARKKWNFFANAQQIFFKQKS